MTKDLRYWLGRGNAERKPDWYFWFIRTSALNNICIAPYSQFFTLLSISLFNWGSLLLVYFSTPRLRHSQLSQLSKIFSKSNHQSTEQLYQTLFNTYLTISTQAGVQNTLYIPHILRLSEDHTPRWLCRALREKFRRWRKWKYSSLACDNLQRRCW